VAYWDLWGKTHNKPLYEIWDLDISNNPITDYTIGMDKVEKMVAKMKETPFPLYKIKLGTPDDLEIMEALRRETNAVFRVDANTAWSVEQTIYFAPELEKLGVEFIEQPLKADNWEGMKRVYEESSLPIIADESCILESDVEKCAGYFHGINIKLMKSISGDDDNDKNNNISWWESRSGLFGHYGKPDTNSNTNRISLPPIEAKLVNKLRTDMSWTTVIVDFDEIRQLNNDSWCQTIWSFPWLVVAHCAPWTPATTPTPAR